MAVCVPVEDHFGGMGILTVHADDRRDDASLAQQTACQQGADILILAQTGDTDLAPMANDVGKQGNGAHANSSNRSSVFGGGASNSQRSRSPKTKWRSVSVLFGKVVVFGVFNVTVRVR